MQGFNVHSVLLSLSQRLQDRKDCKRLRCPTSAPRDTPAHCLYPCFPRVQVLGVTVSPTCHQQPASITENWKDLDQPRLLEPVGHWETMLLQCLARMGTFPSPYKHPGQPTNVLGAPALCPAVANQEITRLGS